MCFCVIIIFLQKSDIAGVQRSDMPRSGRDGRRFLFLCGCLSGYYILKCAIRTSYCSLAHITIV